MKRLKTTQIAEYKKKILTDQGGRCGLCEIDLSTMPTRDICLDHDHKAGHVRAALCRNCNGIEGKIYNLANRGKRRHSVPRFVELLLEYWSRHDPEGRTDLVYHPNHRTDDEKRVERNRKARLARAKKQAIKNVKGK